MILEWTEPAVNALQGIHDYIARDQPFYAVRFIERIVATAERLRDFPELGRRVPETDKSDVRELISRVTGSSISTGRTGYRF